MSFDTTFGLRETIELSGFIFGGGGAWATLRAVVRNTADKLRALSDRFDKDAEKNEAQHEENTKLLGELRLQVARECVHNDEFRRFDDRLEVRLKSLEHSLNNNATKMEKIVRDALRDTLPRGRE